MPAPSYPYAYSSSQTQVGLALETTHGTYVTPTLFIPTKAPLYKPDEMFIPDETLQGSMVKLYALVRGLRYDSHKWGSFPYLTSFPALVRAQLGSSDHKTTAASATTLATAVTAGAAFIKTVGSVTAGQVVVIGKTTSTVETHYVVSVSTVTKKLTLLEPVIYPHASGVSVTPLTVHKFSLLNNAGYGNQPPTYSITDYDGERTRNLTACQQDKLTLKGNPTELITYTVTWLCNAATTHSGTVTWSWTRQAPPPSWSSVILITTTVVTRYQDWTLDFSRTTKPIPALTGNTNYLLFFADALTVKGKLTVLESTGSPQLTAYEAGTVMKFDVCFFDYQTGNFFRFHSNKAMFKTTGGINRSKPEVTVTLTITFLPSTTTATTGGVSPCSVTVANAITTSF
jgi:hypothetical protein